MSQIVDSTEYTGSPDHWKNQISPSYFPPGNIDFTMERSEFSVLSTQRENHNLFILGEPGDPGPC